MLGFFSRLGMLIGGIVLLIAGIGVILWPIWGWELARTSDIPTPVLVVWVIGVAVAVLVSLIALDDEGVGSFREPLVSPKQAIVVWLISPFLLIFLVGLICYGLIRGAHWLAVGEI